MSKPAALQCLALFIVGLYARVAPAQSIIAGEHGTNGHYFDVDPDETFATGPFQPWGYYTVDIDGNGSTDVELYSIHSGGLGGYSTVVYATCGPATTLAQGPLLCSDPSAHAFEAGATIDANAIWTTSTLRLAYSYYYMGQDQCSGNLFANVRFMGTRHITGQDTLYGWIGVSAAVSPAFTIRDFACNNGASGMLTSAAATDRYFFDAASRELTILLAMPSSTPLRLDVYDALGRPVLSRAAGSHTGSMTLTLESLDIGTYTFNMLTDGRKVLKGWVVIPR